MAQETPRGLTSTLTIIRVPPSLEHSAGCSPSEQVVTPKTPRSRPRSATSVGSAERSCTVSQTSENVKSRVSFASSCFSRSGESGGLEEGSGAGSTSLPRDMPSCSPVRSSTARNRARSHSALPTRGASTFQTRRASLSPEQIHDLARSSLELRITEGASDLETPLSAHFNPFPQNYAPAASQHSSRPPDPSPDSPTAPFIPLPESHYLPFIERPSEVEDLLSTEANRRLMALLKQTFPPDLRDAPGTAGEQNPLEWSFLCLASFLTECPRSTSPDPIWVFKVRRCIRARSEVIWERLKDVIGVPPELNVDEPFERAAPGPRDRQIDGVDEEDAWVEPIFPPTSPLRACSPVSPTDVGDGGFAYGGRGNVMDTIGEREEENTAQTGTNTRANSFDAAKAASSDHLTPFGPIHALRLCTRVSFSEGQASPSGATKSVSPSDAASTRPVGHSCSRGHDDGVRRCGGLGRSFSHEHVRRPSTGCPAFERGPGNPLFPSNFGRLSIGPTLAANNPVLRQHAAPPPSAYLAPALRPAADGLHVPESTTGNDYAITVASGSERSF